MNTRPFASQSFPFSNSISNCRPALDSARARRSRRRSLILLLFASCLCPTPYVRASQQAAPKNKPDSVEVLLAAMRLRTAIYAAQHPSANSPARSGGSPGKASAPSKGRCPASFIGTWVENNDEGEGVLGIDERTITGGSLTGRVVFSADCGRFELKEDGSLSFTAAGAEALFTSGGTNDMAVHPTVTISNRAGGLLLEIGDYYLDLGGAFRTGNAQEHVLASYHRRQAPAATAAPANAEPMRLQVGANVQSQKLIRRVDALYPPLAKQARISGVVKLSAVIAKDGTVKDLKVLSGHPLLIQAALDAVHQWLYKPTLLNGNPVEVSTTMDVPFTLEQPQ